MAVARAVCIEVNLSHPYEEITQCVAIIANAHPGKEKEIMKRVQIWVGEQIKQLEGEKNERI